MRGDHVGLVGHSKYTDSYLEANGEPLESFEQRSDVISQTFWQGYPDCYAVYRLQRQKWRQFR